MRRQCAKAADQWARGAAGRPNPLAGRPCFMSVWPVASWTRVYTRRGRERQWRKSVEASPPSHVAWPAGNHMAGYRHGHVDGVPPRPYKYTPTGGNQKTHHILEIPLAKLPFLV
jgi:hypothetical protein